MGIFDRKENSTDRPAAPADSPDNKMPPEEVQAELAIIHRMFAKHRDIPLMQAVRAQTEARLERIAAWKKEKL